MARPTQDVTDAELAVLQVLWDRGSATIRQLTDAVYPQGGASAYATVQKLLERLEAKGCVHRDRGPSVHRFSAVLDRNALIGQRLEAMAEKLCGGSLTPLLTHLVKAERLSPGDLDELRELIDRLDRRKSSRTQRG
jgi:BlaI family penicillinase repressor